MQSGNPVKNDDAVGNLDLMLKVTALTTTTRLTSQVRSILKEHYEFCDTSHQEVIQYISTRWLSLEICISGELKKFVGLKSYFLSHRESDARFRRLQSAYEDPTTEIYLLFFHAVLPCFNNFNKLLQQEEPLFTSCMRPSNVFCINWPPILLSPQ